MGVNATEPRDVLSRIAAQKTVTIEDVLVMRRRIWPDGRITKPEAEILFYLHSVVEDSCAEWDDFFVEILTACLVDEAHPEGYVSEADTTWLESHIALDGKLPGAIELELLISILERAVHVPHRLEILALVTIRNAVLGGYKALVSNQDLQKGTIDDPEAALLRRVLYSTSGARSDAISFDEAKLIYDLDRHSDQEQVCLTWTTVFVTVMSGYLLDQSGYRAPERARLKKIDTWLNRPSTGVTGFSSAVSVKKPKVMRSGRQVTDIKTAFSEFSPLKAAYAAPAANDYGGGQSRFSPEGQWLVDELCRTEPLTPNERALLVFLRIGKYDVHPALMQVIRRSK